MRIITSFEKENVARRFSMYLQKMDIKNTIDVDIDDTTKKFSYQIWVHEEDKIDVAQKYLDEFHEKSNDPKYDVSLKEIMPIDDEAANTPIEEKQTKNIIKKGPSIRITSFILFVCIFIYLLNSFQEKKIREENPKLSVVLLTPMQKELLFDVSQVLIKEDEVIRKYNIDPTKDIKKQSQEAYSELEKIEKIPYWRGIYEVILRKKTNPNEEIKIKGILFEKIRKGQFWRLLSPCFLHKDLLHILFNMMWLWLLGKQIEQRLSRYKYLVLIVLVGVISNVFQYLMSGPNFLGYSGIIMGMVGFIWARQKNAPWEGYPLQKSVFLFLAVYVLLMFILSFFSFATQFVGFNLLSTNIANTAHIMGAIVGWGLGRLSFFSWSPHHER